VESCRRNRSFQEKITVWKVTLSDAQSSGDDPSIIDRRKGGSRPYLAEEEVD